MKLDDKPGIQTTHTPLYNNYICIRSGINARMRLIQKCNAKNDTAITQELHALFNKSQNIKNVSNFIKLRLIEKYKQR